MQSPWARRRRWGPAIVGQGLPRAGCSWSGAIYVYVRVPTVIRVIFEANSGFHVKWITAAGVQFRGIFARAGVC